MCFLGRIMDERGEVWESGGVKIKKNEEFVREIERDRVIRHFKSF